VPHIARMAETRKDLPKAIADKLAEIDQSIDDERRRLEQAQSAIDARKRAKAEAKKPKA
jgi:hypothetical protein